MPVDELEKTEDLVPDITAAEEIRSLIHIIRGKQVILDSDLAMLYRVETKVFNQAVKRNIERFPEEFRFQLTKEEFDFLRSQFVTSISALQPQGRGVRTSPTPSPSRVLPMWRFDPPDPVPVRARGIRNKKDRRRTSPAVSLFPDFPGPSE